MAASEAVEPAEKPALRRSAGITYHDTVIDVTGNKPQPLPASPSLATPASPALPPEQSGGGGSSLVNPRLAEWLEEAAAPAGQDQSYSGYSYEDIRLGTRFRQKLGLNNQQVSWLNKFWSPNTAFLGIEGCCIATIELHLRVLAELQKQFRRAGTTLAKETAALQEVHFHGYKAHAEKNGWWVGDDLRYWGDRTETDLHLTIFRRCENAVREQFGHKRKLAAEFVAYLPEVESAFINRFGRQVDELIEQLRSQIAPPNAATERALNVQNPTRWKPKLEALAAQLQAGEVATFVQGVYELGDLNERNPSVENIFFEASKLIAGKDREEALRFYLHYLDRDRRSAVVNNKALTKTIQKSLFPKPEYLARFEEIVQQFHRDGQLQPALDRVPEVYARQRRAVALDKDAIQAVRQQHASTVEKLNDYLRDEESPVSAAPLVTEEVPSVTEGGEVALHLPPTSTPATGGYVADLFLTEAQQRLLERFAANQLRLSQDDVAAFAQEHGLLKNQLVDSLNEQCYSLLDDVLIEEEDTEYTIYPNHYHKLLPV